MEDKQYFVYILARERNSTFYVGVTSNLVQRIYQHKHKIIKGFTSKYNVMQLVYYEIHGDVNEAICREKSIKRWTRKKKMRAIEEMNPEWHDLYHDLIG